MYDEVKEWMIESIGRTEGHKPGANSRGTGGLGAFLHDLDNGFVNDLE